MKNLVSRILLVSTALVGAVAAQAQNHSMTADVPFSFHIGATVMPSGAYRIDEAHNAIWMTSAHAMKGVAATRAVGKAENESARLVFNCYDSECFLASAWSGGGRTGLAVPRSSKEKELASIGGPALAVVRVALK